MAGRRASDSRSRLVKKSKKVPVAQPEQVSLGSFIYYIVVFLAALAGLTTYSAGAALEIALVRMIIVLLIGLIFGYAFNVAIVISSLQRLQPRVIAGRHSLREELEPAAGRHDDRRQRPRQGYLGLAPGPSIDANAHPTAAGGAHTSPMGEPATPSPFSASGMEAETISETPASDVTPPETASDFLTAYQELSDTIETPPETEEIGGR